MTYEVLARKWRPRVFDEVIGQEHITRTLMNAIKGDRLAHAYLFSGARGVGKTSVARILAKAVNCRDGKPGIPCNQCNSCKEITAGSSVDVQEIDGASNRGIDEIRELRDNIKYMPSSSLFRVYIVDEVHMLTLPAFNALLKTLEEPPPHVKFIFATTDPHKVPVTILSRCQRFDFKRIPVGKIVDHLIRITEEEGIDIGKASLTIIAREAGGSMRDAESLLDQVVSFAGAKVEEGHISEILGIIDRDLIFETSRAILAGRPDQCVDIAGRIYNYGYDIKEFYRALMDQFRNLLISQVAPDLDLLELTEDDREEINRQAAAAGVEKLHQCLNFLIKREEDLRYTSHPRLVLETIMIKLCRMGEVLGFEELIQRIGDLESRLSEPGTGEMSEIHPERIADPEPDKQDTPEKVEKTRSATSTAGETVWDELLNHLSRENRPMYNVLREWRLAGFSGDTLELIRGDSPFSAVYLDDEDRLKKFTASCREFFKKEVRVKILDAERPALKKSTQGRAQKKEKKTGKHADLPRPVQEVLHTFKGEIKEEKTID